MSSHFSPATVDDRQALIDFLTRVFDTNRNAPFVSPDLLRWKYWDPCENYSEPRSLILEREGQIAAMPGFGR